MKKILSFAILCCFCFYANISSLEAQEELYMTAQNKIEEARLLENYITRYIIRIRTIENQYPSIESSYVEEILENIGNILLVLENIQKWNFTVGETEVLIEWVIRYMKDLNWDIQTKIIDQQIQERESLEKLRNEYLGTVTQIYTITERIIDIYSRHYLWQLVLDQRDRNTINLIISLREKNRLLEIFKTQKFQNSEQMKNYLQKTVTAIRDDVRALKYQRER